MRDRSFSVGLGVLAWVVVGGCKSDPSSKVVVDSKPPEHPVNSSLQEGPSSSRVPVPGVTKIKRTRPPEPSSVGVPGRVPPPMPTPQMPPAEEHTERSYKVDGSSVEVEGVCKFSEDSITCWDLDGRSNDDLATKIKDSVSKQGASNFTISYGKKNRLVVAKLTQMAGGRMGSQASLNVQSAGSSYSGGGYMSLNFQESRMVESGKPYYRYEGRVAIEEAGAKTTTLHLLRADPIMEKVTIDCKVGASATFGGVTYTVASIKKGTDLGRNYGMPVTVPGGPATWTVRLKRVLKAANSSYVSLQAAGPDGTPYQFADKDGNPATLAQYQKSMQEMYSRSHNTGYNPAMQPYRSVMGGMSTSTPTELFVTVYINPAKISKFVFQGNRSKTVDITGIPLDPK